MNDDARKIHDELCLNAAVREIQGAEIVSIDLEFSGLFEKGWSRADAGMAEYYSTCRTNAQLFLIVQIGICCGRRNPEDERNWILSPMSFHVFPQKRTVFSSDSKSLSWLVDQGFDPRKWISEGFGYEQLANITNPHRQVDPYVQKTGVQRLIEALMENPRPLVVHNGFLDVLQIIQKFVENLPETLALFGSRLVKLFPEGVYDTKRMAEQGKILIFHIADKGRGATTLDALKQHLWRDREKRSRTLIATVDAKNGREGYSLQAEKSAKKRRSADIAQEGAVSPLDQVGSHQMKAAHDAGYDAMITLEVFLMMMDRVRETEEIPRANCWQEWTFFKKVVNKIEISGISPGYFEFPEPVKEKNDVKNREEVPSVTIP